jgi:hypothetical protein
MNVNNFCRETYDVLENMRVENKVRNRTKAWMAGVGRDQVPTVKEIEWWKHHATCNLARAAAACDWGVASIHADQFFEGGWGTAPHSQGIVGVLNSRVLGRGRGSLAGTHHGRGPADWHSLRAARAGDSSQRDPSLKRMGSVRHALGLVLPLYHTKGHAELSCGWKMFPSHLCNWGVGCNFGRGINGPLGESLAVPLTAETADKSGLTDALKVLGLSSVVILKRRSSLDYFISGSISQQTQNWRVTGNASDVHLDHKYSLNADSLHARIIEHRNFNQYLEQVFPPGHWMYLISEDLMEHPVDTTMKIVEMIAPTSLNANALARTRAAVQKHADEYLVPYDISENRERLLAFVDEFVDNWPEFVARLKYNGDEKELEI